MSISATRKFHICAGHRVMGHESKCAHLHGHNYTIYVTARMRELPDLSEGQEPKQLDPIGRVLDFSEIKHRLGTWLEENWDHGFILHEKDDRAIEAVQFFVARELSPAADAHTLKGQQVVLQKLHLMPYNPTAENMAHYLLTHICPEVFKDTNVLVTKVRVWETDNCFADADPE